tara:strand:+ start:3371 stop:3934 length:564 start_codon:yes stop_codon:yes gene_type:complete
MNLLDIDFEQRMLATVDAGPEITKFNPIGRVPSLILDDGKILIDSGAIIDFLVETYDSDRDLLPSVGERRRAILQTTALAHAVMEKGVAASYEKTRRAKEKICRKWLAHLETQAQQGLLELEKTAASKSSWLHGCTITVADVTVICAFDYIFARNPILIEDSNLEALASLSERGNRIEAFIETAPKM